MKRIHVHVLLLGAVASGMGCAGTDAQRPGSGTFVCAPSWTAPAQIVRSLFGATLVACRASDGRHVVLAQSHFYTQTLRKKVREGGQIVYTSPNGFRAWRGGPEKWYSQTALRSARHIIKDPPADERCGYVIESPRGDFAILAVNGPVREDELVDLVNSLTFPTDPPAQRPPCPE